MNFVKIAPRRQRMLQYLLFLGTAIAVVVGLAQTQAPNPDRVLIDGSSEPERIPEWIIWNELFQMAVQLNEISPTHGQELWIQKLSLPEDAMGEIIAHGYEHLEMTNASTKEAEEHVANSKKDDSDLKDHPNKEEALKSKLVQTQLNREARTLEIRDKLRERIGEDAFLRLSSFARLQIAPKIKIGG